jgi:hypothetical protein
MAFSEACSAFSSGGERGDFGGAHLFFLGLVARNQRRWYLMSGLHRNKPEWHLSPGSISDYHFPILCSGSGWDLSSSV